MSTQPEKDGAVGGVTSSLDKLNLDTDEGNASYDGLKKPRVHWTQDETSITLIVNIVDLKEYETKTGGADGISRSTILFKSNLPTGYGFRLTLLGKVLELEPANDKLTGQSLKLKLTKLSPGYLWPYLTATNEILRWLKLLPSKDFKDEEDDIRNLGNLTRYVSNVLATDVKEAVAAESKRKIALEGSGAGLGSSEDEDDYSTDEAEGEVS